MCGLAGVFTRQRLSGIELKATVSRMSDAIAHRGPDDSGHWVDEGAGVALGFRRLAIVDLSEQGHQPMRSATGRYTLIFNGEVYNHRGLRRDLERLGFRFRGHSDTEVILAAFEQWGIAAAVKRFIGMFAMAVWDADLRKLSLLRDRLGIKPLFVYQRGNTLTFGSELKALVNGPEFDRSINPAALSAYLRYLYVPAPDCIFARVLKLPPGHILTISDPAAQLSPVAYWSVEACVARGAANPFDGDDTAAVAELESLLGEAVRLRMEADVPLGALLSGGIDSSTVVALMQVASSRPIKTFTIGFDHADFDEASHARGIANHLGTDHTELHLTGDDALAVVPDLSTMFDEPLADPSQIPTFLVCRLARRDVTVALTGDGGDELFGGYNRYISGERMIAGAQRWPRVLRRVSAAGAMSFSPRSWNRVRDVLRPVFPAVPERLFGERVHKIGELLRADSPADMYRSLLSAWQSPDEFVDVRSANPGRRHDSLNRTSLELMESMMLADQKSYLPDDLLAKVDRASMAVSLEARVPILDHRIVEFSWRLPRHFKVRAATGKWILRQVLYKHVPRALVDRDKMGFSVPLAQWLSGPLREWAGDLMVSGRQGALRGPLLSREWDNFQRGRSANAPGLWALVMFRAWEDRWLRHSVPAASPLLMERQA